MFEAAPSNNAASQIKTTLFLASSSAMRAALLRQIGLVFTVIPTVEDPPRLTHESPESYVQRSALTKLEAGLQHLGTKSHPYAVIAADTLIKAPDGHILGKPIDRNNALAMLGSLSANKHQVLSGIAFSVQSKTRFHLNVNDVWFRAVSNEESEICWESGEMADRAGGYALQGRAAAFIQHVEGSCSGIMGLPLYELMNMFHDAGLKMLADGSLSGPSV